MLSRILNVDSRSRASTLALPDVTLIAVTSVAVPQTIRAMSISLAHAQFGAAGFFSDRPLPADASDDIAWIEIKPIRSRLSYSKFMLRDLRNHIATSHVLCVQWDGYVLHGGGWHPEFLDYDYIGAPWPHFADGHSVGNGGFSLRSRRLLDACYALRIEETPEDVAICRIHRTTLERDFAIRFAPESLARRFAFERYAPTGCEFGFHGAFNLAQLTDADTFGLLIDELEPGILNRREHRELLRAALRRGRLTLARTLIRRMFQEGARKR